MSPILSDYFGQGGEQVDDLTVNAYLASRFGTPPAQGSAPPAGSPDATTATTTTKGGPGAFQLSLPSNDLYWVSVEAGGVLYWKLYNAALVTDPGGALPLGTGASLHSGSGVPSSGFGADGDFYFDSANTSASELYKKVAGAWVAISGGGGGDALLGWGLFTNGADGANPAAFSATIQSGLTYLEMDGVTFDLPAGSVTLAILQAAPSGSNNWTYELDLVNAGGASAVSASWGPNDSTDPTIPGTLATLLDGDVVSTFQIGQEESGVSAYAPAPTLVLITFSKTGGGGGGSGVSSFETRTGDVVLEAADVEGLFLAKGDLLVGTGAGTAEFLAPGADGTALTADAAAPSGLAWAAPGALSSLAGHISGDVTLTQNVTTSVFTTAGLTPGTWLLIATVLCFGAGAEVDAEVLVGSGSATFGGPTSAGTKCGSITGPTDGAGEITIACLVVVTSTAVIELQAFSGNASGTAVAETQIEGYVNATGYVAVKIA